MDGGGIYTATSGGQVQIANSTLYENHALQHAGGIYTTGTTIVSLVNSTIAQNYAGTISQMISHGQSQVTLANSIIACWFPRIDTDCYDFVQPPTLTNSILGVKGTYYGIAELADNGGPTKTMALDVSSPLVDAGDDAICASASVDHRDQRGIARPQGSHCDIGAYEYNGTFSDAPLNYWAWDFIERLYNAGITGGCSTSPLQYCPDSTVTRAQMAIFLERGIHGSSYNPPAVGGSTGFNDVPLAYWAAAWIKQLAADGITGGCGSGSYCPEGAVTRAQMAIFLLRSKHGAGYNPPAVGAGTGFSDVSPSYWAAAWIKQLVAEGITAGCGTGIYCPEAPVTRAQMAVFLVRTFNLP